jgi:hypothetical protein
MVLVSDCGLLDYQPVSSLLIQTLIAAFTFLSALSIRDSVTQLIALMSPGETTKKLLFTLFTTMLFLFITVFMAWYWQDQINSA